MAGSRSHLRCGAFCALSKALGCAALAAILLASGATISRAETPPADAANAASSKAAKTIAKLDCDDAGAAPIPAGNLKLKLSLDGSTVWQPRNGEVRFTISGTDFEPGNMSLIGCFRWQTAGTGTEPNARKTPQAPTKPLDTSWYTSSYPARVVDVGMHTITFAVTVPAQLPDAAEWWQRLTGGNGGVYTGLLTVPVAEFRIVASSDAGWSHLQASTPVGITSLWYSYILAVLLVALACGALALFARWRGVPGTWFLLRIISTKRGYASLSQLQITMWSFVIGGSAIFVMALSGNLIDISQGTLVLLGITGAATVGSKLQSHTETQSKGSDGTGAVPSAVTGSAVIPPATDSEIRLSWNIPMAGGTADSYSVFYQEIDAAGALGPLICASRAVTKPRFAIVGLSPATAYSIQVIAVNKAGTGPAPAAPLVATTAAAPTLAAGAPGQVVGVSARRGPDRASLDVSWTAAVGANNYVVECRIHDSDDLWTPSTPAAETTRRLFSLRPNTLYDVRVRARSTLNGDGRPSAVAQAMSGTRVPQWSDLVVSSDDNEEIDVTRVQMLFFTVISALFVLIRVSASGVIPAIPDGFLLLMGISNGVYLTAKFVPD